jgi:hypothetical protein
MVPRFSRSSSTPKVFRLRTSTIRIATRRKCRSAEAAAVTNARPLQLQAAVRAYSLDVKPGLALPNGGLEARVQNNFETVRVTAHRELRGVRKHAVHSVAGDIEKVPFQVSAGDIATFHHFEFRVETAKATYDLMTDYPYLVLDAKGKTLLSGGLERNTLVTFDKLAEKKAGDFVLHVQGAFTEKAPSPWVFELTETRVLEHAIDLGEAQNLLLEQGQFQSVDLPAPADLPSIPEGFAPCPSLILDGDDGQNIQIVDVCR